MGVMREMRLVFVASAVAVTTTVVSFGAHPVRAAGEFTVAPTDLAFGSVAVGATATVDVTVTNTSSSSLTPNFSGGAPADATNFGASQDCAGKTFGPGDTCTFTYEFTPAAPGSFTSNTTIGIDADDFSITMSGTGTPAFDVAPTNLTFPDTPVGGTSAIDVVVTNVGSASLTPNFSGGAPIDPTHFGGSQNCAGKTFAPGDTCAFTYEFTPQAEGTWSTTTTIGVDSENVSITMTGTTGAAPTTTTATTTTTPTATTEQDDTTAPTASSSVPDADAIVIVEPPLPAGSDAAVIAQGFVELETDAIAWHDSPVAPDGWPLAFDGTSAAMLALAGRDAVLVSADTPLALLDDGEATFLPAGVSAEAAPIDTPAAADTAASTTDPSGEPEPVAHVLSLVPATGTGAFAPGEGNWDLNLIRDVLAPGDTLEVRSPFPIAVIVTDGDLVDTRDGDAVLTSDTLTTLDTTIVLRNDTEEPATVLAAALGGRVPVIP